jgi:hypothetical protein
VHKKADNDIKPLVLNPVSGPQPPDMSALVEEGRKRHEAELASAQKVAREARAGSAPKASEPPPIEPPAPGEIRIEFDWRGETAYYVEHDRRVRLECIYWGGPIGHLAHTDGHWQYRDGGRMPLTDIERESVLERVVVRAREGHNITLAARQ